MGYKPFQSKCTMGEFPEDYEIKVNGKTIWLREHLAKGVSKKEEHSIRISFYYDEQTQKVLVGFLGRHQKTRAT